MKRITIMLAGFFAGPVLLFAGNEKNSVPAQLTSATVYRSGAELIHTATATLKQGNNELVIEGLSNSLDINSVQIGCDEKITIMSVTFSTDYLKPETKPASVKRWEDSLETLNKEMLKIQAVLNTNRDLQEVLKANRDLRGTQNGLSVAELVKMMDYYKNKTLELQNEINLYADKEQNLDRIIQKIKLQLNEEEQKNTKMAGKLTLQLLSPAAAAGRFTISYITAKAYWNPYYDLRVDNITQPVTLVYKAKLVQTTGLDWKQVKLTLATSNPGTNNIAPVLKSWFLTYANFLQGMNNATASNYIQSLEGRVAGLSKPASLDEVAVTGYYPSDADIRLRGGATGKDATPLYVLDGKIISQKEFQHIDAVAIKNVEVLKDGTATAMYGTRGVNGVILVTLKDNIGDYLTVKDNALNVTYIIDIPYDVPGNGKEQSVVLKESPVNAVYKYYSVPKMDKDAYLLGEITNWEQLNLLAGEANIIFEGTYTGKTFIDPASTNDTLNLTLGRDKRIAVKKEKLKDFSSVKFLGNNKKQVFTYEITVKNNKKEAVQLVLKDQYPLSTNKEIEVELIESSGAADNPELGVLTWKLQLAPGESKKLRVGYSVKYTRDKFINAG
jgi:TonB-dependent SusC/RagA subfamily outer membrane receptor